MFNLKRKHSGNNKNKKRLLQAVSLELHRWGVTSYTAEENAYYDIIDVSLWKSIENTKVVVVGTYTGLLVMLVALAPRM